MKILYLASGGGIQTRDLSSWLKLFASLWHYTYERNGSFIAAVKKWLILTLKNMIGIKIKEPLPLKHNRYILRLTEFVSNCIELLRWAIIKLRLESYLLINCSSLSFVQLKGDFEPNNKTMKLPQNGFLAVHTIVRGSGRRSGFTEQRGPNKNSSKSSISRYFSAKND